MTHIGNFKCYSNSTKKMQKEVDEINFKYIYLNVSKTLF